MRYFPMFLDMAGRRVLLAGGGEEMAQKARLLRRTEAALTVMAARPNAELAALIAEGRADHAPADEDPAAIAAADYAFIATGDEARDTRIAAAARAGGARVNVVDRPAECDMITPAIVDRDPVVVAIGTEGAAPVLGRAIKTKLEAELAPSLGPFIAMIQSLRDDAAAKIEMKARRPFWRWAILGAPWRLWRGGDAPGARALIEEAIAAGAPPEPGFAGVALIAAPAAADLLPLRAVARLQEASTIFHGPEIDGGVLELARRDALRVTLLGCPRGDLTAILAAEGPVAVITAAPCRPPDGAGWEVIAPASAG